MTNIVSTTNYPVMFRCMETNGIGVYIKRVREERGLTQRQLAELADTSAAYVSQIEGGKVAWPGADIRRRIAKALNVSHLSLIVAAGELEPDEIAAAGVEGVVNETPDSPRRVLKDLVDQVNWDANAERVESVEGLLRGYIAFDERKRAGR